MSLSGLGDGWSAAILNSLQEFRFVWSTQMQIDHSHVGIGGTSNSSHSPYFYYEYIPNDTGIIFKNK